MNYKSLLILPFLLLFINAPSFTYSNSNSFEGIKLTPQLPQIFEAGENFYLKGYVENFNGKARITADLNFIDGDFRCTEKCDSDDSTFTVKLDLKHAGSYYLSLTANYKSRGTIILKAVKPVEIDSMRILPVSDFGISSDHSGIDLSWHTENELLELKFSHPGNGAGKSLVLSNNPQAFELNPDDFAEFSPGAAEFSIRGARSVTGSKYTKCSGWSEWRILPVMLIEQLWSLEESSVKYSQPYKNVGEPGAALTVELKIRKHYDPIAYVKRPDGWVEHVALQSNKYRKEFTVGAGVTDLLQPGNCTLSYTPDIAGIYIFEINDAYSNALLNIPFYCGIGIPLLTEKQIPADSSNAEWDVNLARNKMLQELNLIRMALQMNPLRLDSSLTNLSQYYSDRMSREHFVSHYAPDDEFILHRKKKFNVVTPLSENVARAKTIETALQNLLRSPIHYEAIIDTAALRAGLGISRDEDGIFFLAQHFAPEPPTQQEMDDFLVKIFDRMHSERKKLIRVYQRSEWPSIASTIFKAPTLQSLENTIFSEESRRGWNYKAVGEVFFESFTQTVDGLILKVKYYPHVKKEEEK